MCHPTAATLKADGVIVADALNIIAGFEPEPIKDDLEKAGTAFSDVAAKWDGSTGAKDLLDAAAVAAEDILADIPTTAAIAPWVAVAVTALDAILANVGTPPAPTTTGNIRAALDKIDALPPNPHRGIAVIKHTGNLRQDLTNAWNDKSDEFPDMHVPKL